MEIKILVILISRLIRVLITCMPSQCYAQHMDQLKEHTLPFVGASGTALQCVGYVTLDMDYQDYKIKQDIYFVKDFVKVF